MEVLYKGMELQTKYQTNDSSQPLKAGDAIQIVVKGRTANNEANAIIKGQEISVKFEGSVPSNDRLTVEITNLNDNGKMVVKPITSNPTPSSSATADQLLEKAGFDPATHTELKEAVKQILSGGGQVSRDTLTNLQSFLQNDPGSLAEKLNTIKIMQQKNIEFTSEQLHAVNEALNGETLNHALSEMIQSSIELRTDQEKGNLQFIKNLLTMIEPTLDVEAVKDFQQAPQTQQIDQGQSTDENSLSTVQTEEPIQSRTSTLGGSNLVQGTQSPQSNQGKQDIQNSDQKDVESNFPLQNKEGSQSAPRSEQEKQVDPKLILSNAEQYLVNEAIQAVPIDSRDLVVTKVTTQLKQMTAEFNQMRQEVSQSLDTAVKVADTKNVTPVNQILELAINKLDKAILKGDYMLYTDMSTEKELLASSSKLAEAKNLLSNGKIQEAIQIVKEVKGSLDQLNFQPSKQTINHFVSDIDLSASTSTLDSIIQPKSDQGARRIFELVKGLGLTHEVDLAHALESKQDVPNNLKSTLLQLTESNLSQTKLMHPLQQALANITGQQLLSKQDSSGAQNMLLQLPIMLNKQVENVKVYVNSHQQGEVVDWENCSLYFVLETKKMGEVGISISAVNRNLSITFKSDNDSLKQTLEPLTATAKEHLQEIGYHVGSIQYKTFSAQAVARKETPVKKQPEGEKKGFDFTV